MPDDTRRDELRLHLRNEPALVPRTVLVRGGPDTVALIRTHARRTHRLYCLDGGPLWGISAFGALDRSGPTSREGLLTGRLASYQFAHLPDVDALLVAGFTLLDSFRRPHFTIRLADDSSEEAARLLAVLGPPEENPYNREVRLRRTEETQ